MIYLSGEHICSKCNKLFEWHAINPESGEVIVYEERSRCLNLHDWMRIDNKNNYSVNYSCPHCGNMRDSDYVQGEIR